MDISKAPKYVLMYLLVQTGNWLHATMLELDLQGTVDLAACVAQPCFNAVQLVEGCSCAHS